MSWYTKTGADSDVVLSTRCRLARNIEKLPIGERLSDKEAVAIIEDTGKALGGGFDRIDFDRIDPLTSAAYVEEHIVSSEFVSIRSPHTLYKNDESGIYIMVCEEDHYRIQAIIRGNSAAEAYRRAAEAEKAISENCKFAFDPTLGYLTRCPTNLGTAMRISGMMFLPAMKKFGEISLLAESLSRLGFTVRGMYGEGSDAVACLYQISNSVTLGLSEEETLTAFSKVTAAVIEAERRFRQKLLVPQTLDSVIDTVCRAYGTLTFAHMMERREFLPLWVEIRLGVSLSKLSQTNDILESLTYETLDTLLIEAEPSVLMLMQGGAELSPRERDIHRAALIKDRLTPQHKNNN